MIKNRCSSILLLPLIAVGILVPISVFAQEEVASDVIEAAEHGRQLFDEGQYEEAAELLLSAYESHREPIFLQYIGRCKQELGLYCQASRYYRLFLSQGEPPDEVRAQLEERMVELDDQCEESSEPTEPDPVEDPEPDETSTESPTTFGHQTEPDEPTPTRLRSDTIGIALMATGGALLAVSVAMWAAGGTIYLVRYDESRQSDDYDTYKALGAVGDVIAAVSGSLLVGGLVTFLVGRNRARSSSNVSFVPGLASGQLTVSF